MENITKKGCARCKLDKPASAFSKDNHIKCGLRSICRVCDGIQNKAYYRKNRDKVKQRTWEHDRTDRGREVARTSSRKMYYKHLQKVRARTAVRIALGNGRLTKMPCEACGDPKSQAHHEDYSKPLSVEWLCITHHRIREGRSVVSKSDYELFGGRL